MGIARVRERRLALEKHETITSALNKASDALAYEKAKLLDMYEREVEERKNRETHLLQAIEDALVPKPNTTGMRDGNNTLDEREKRAIERVEKRTYEELQYKLIKTALAAA